MTHVMLELQDGSAIYELDMRGVCVAGARGAARAK